jgi:hypothetical protein
MRDCFYQFLRSDTVLDSSAKVKSKLVRAIQRNKCSHRDQTSVALGQFFAFPNISEKDIVGQLDQLGREVAEQLRRPLKLVRPGVQLLGDRRCA